MAEPMYPGEIRPKTIRLDRRDGSALTISSAQYQVFTLAGVSQGAAATAATITIDAYSATVTAQVTVPATAGSYYVEFTVVVESSTLKARIGFTVA